MKPVFPTTIKDSGVGKAVHEDRRPKSLKTGICGPVLESLISGMKLKRVRGAVDLYLEICLRIKVVVPLRVRFLYAKKAKVARGVEGYWRVDD